MISSILSVLWLLCGLVAVLTMMSLLGRLGKSEGARHLRTTHRTVGWCFTAGYLAFLVIMIPKWTSNGPLLPTPLVAHATLGLLLFPLLLVKHLVVRVFKKYFPALPYLGVILFTIAFVVVGLTGLQRMVLWAEGPMVTIQSGDTQRTVSAAVGRDLLQSKCARCHSLKPDLPVPQVRRGVAPDGHPDAGERPRTHERMPGRFHRGVSCKRIGSCELR